MLIKVCGLKYEDNIRSVLELNPQFVGFNFYSQSPRYVNDETLLALKKIDFGSTKRTGVFVNERVENILEIADKYDLEIIQLHGDESSDDAKTIKRHYAVIKAIGIEVKEDLNQAIEYEGCTDYILLDKKSPMRGGTGIPFDWELIEYYSISVPFFLGGGLSYENIKAAKSIQHPKFAGLDLNSGFEDSPGVKNIEKLKIAFSS